MAKIFRSEQIRKIDAFTIGNEPISSLNLMERAASALFGWFSRKFSKSASFVFFSGPGNNGGDGWALARLLFHHGYKNIRFYLFLPSGNISEDSEINRQRLLDETDLTVEEIKAPENFPFLLPGEWVVDALFGTGLSRPLNQLAFELVDHINSSETSGIISIDIPSGLFSENNLSNNPSAIIKAGYTLSFQFPKLSFFFAENSVFVGEWEVLPIGLHPQIIHEEFTPFEYSSAEEISYLIKPRAKFSHKGNYGHALIISGSYGMMGAAVLCVRSAICSGAGLVTCHIPKTGYQILQTSAPEALVSLDESDILFSGIDTIDKYSAIAVGPGLNTKSETARAFFNLLEKIKCPLVIDADALNILSEHREWLDLLPENSILTPHPKEFDRLTVQHKTHYERFMAQIDFSVQHKVITVLKGAHTSICLPDGKAWFNTTGNPGMAKGGCGDILTGIIVSLLAQGYSPAEAAKIGVFVHGLAGDLALKKKGYHAVCHSDIIKKLGKAFKKIE